MDRGLAAGSVLGGRYEIVEALDRGGHGIVYRAKQRPLGREVAVKVMLPEVAAGPGMAERFAREVSLVQRLEHPNTVRLYDFGATDDGTAFMVFELLRGPSLESEMAKGPMPPVRVAKIAVQILKSLMEAHALGIVHRDVKPANVLLVDYSGEPDFVKVLDFGVARPMDEASRAITRDGQLVGTPAYMAPEQVKGEPITARTDLYALGIIIGRDARSTVRARRRSGCSRRPTRPCRSRSGRAPRCSARPSSERRGRARRPASRRRRR